MDLRAALTDAYRRDKITSNPAARVPAPPTRDHEAKTLSQEQASRLLATINGDTLGPLFTLMLTTGLRLGEALGLTWDRIDFASGRLTVAQGLQWLTEAQATIDG